MTRLMIFDGNQSVPVKADPLDCSWSASAQATACVITSIPSSNGSASFTISGTIKTSSGTNIPSGNGTITIQKLVGSTWTDVYTGIAITTGTWTKTGVTITATTSFRAVYTGYLTTYLGSSSSSKTVTYASLTTFVKSYACSSSGSYNGDGTKRTDSGSDLYQGYYSTTHDEQRSVICFPSTTVAADLAGALDILKVEVYLNALHWGPDSGGTARVRTCNNSSVPSTWSGVASLSAYDETAWTTKTGAKWCDITSIMGTLANWQSGGTKKGIALYAANTATEYYGYFAGNGASGEPVLRITYRKYV